jgi:hypothetical protein
LRFAPESRAALNDGGIAYGPSFVFGSYLEMGALRQVLPQHGYDRGVSIPFHQ